MFRIPILCSLDVIRLLHTLKKKKKKYAQNILFDSGVYSREIMNMFFVGPVSWLVEIFNTGIYSDTINVINVKLRMMAQLIELCLFNTFRDFDHF